MFYIFLSVLCNILLFVILKGFPKYNIPAIQGIVVNYFVAGGTALFFIGGNTSFKDVVSSSWFTTCLIEGTLFISIFYLLSVTSRKISIAVASVANKMSVVIPVLFSVLFYHEKINAIKITGLAIALLAVYLTVKPKSGDANAVRFSSHFILPLLVFLGSGVIDSIITYADKEKIPIAVFIAACFFVAGGIGIAVLAGGIALGRIKFVPRSIPAGIILGIPNYFSIYFIMLALCKSGMQSSQVYPIVNTGVVLGSTLAGLFIFKEHLSKWNYAGIILAVIAIALISGQQ